MKTKSRFSRAAVSLALLLVAMVLSRLPGGRAMAAEICAPTGIQCEWDDGRVLVTVATNPRCPCEEIRVVRDQRREIPLVRAPALFEDADPPGGTHTYSAACFTHEGASASVSCTISLPCKIEGLIAKRENDTSIRVTWLPADEGCCEDLFLSLSCDGVTVFGMNVEGRTELILSDGCISTGNSQTVCVTCISSGGFKSSACLSLGDGAFVRGNANADARIDIADAVFVLTYLFAKGTAPSCLDAADANDSGAVDIADAIAVLSHLFAQTGPLPEPFPACGIDPSSDALDCVSFAPCD